MTEIQKLLEAPIFTNNLSVNAKIVVRRTRMSAREVDYCCQRGICKLGGEETCDLVVNGSVIATGTITERDGKYFFSGAKI